MMMMIKDINIKNHIFFFFEMIAYCHSTESSSAFGVAALKLFIICSI